MNKLTQATLTSNEQAELDKCESILSTNMDAFLEVGAALQAIRDGRLYREKYGTFEKYLRERWNIPRTLAYYYLDAAEVSKRLLCQNFDIHPRAVEIIRAGQLQELKHVATDDLPAVVDRAVQIAGTSTLTAKVLKRAAKEINLAHAMTDTESGESVTSSDSNSTGEVNREAEGSTPASFDKVPERARERLRDAIKCIRLQFGHLGLGGKADVELQSISRKAEL